MKIPKSRIPKQWLAIWYCVVLSAGTAILSCGTKSPEYFLCAQSDNSLAVCARSWLAPLAALSSFIVAVVALYFARRQYLLARQQQRQPILKDRLLSIDKLQQKVNTVLGRFYDAMKSFDLIIALFERSNGVNFSQPIDDARSRLELLLTARRELRASLGDATIDIDLLTIAEAALRDSDLLADYDTRLLASSIMSGRLNPVDIIVYRDRGHDKANRTFKTLQDVHAELNRKGQSIKDERVGILSDAT